MTEQQKYVIDLINEWRNREIENIGGPYGRKFSTVLSKPEKVVKAENNVKRYSKIVNAWEHKAAAAHKRETERINRLARAARERVMFNTPEIALAFVKKLLSSKG